MLLLKDVREITQLNLTGFIQKCNESNKEKVFKHLKENFYTTNVFTLQQLKLKKNSYEKYSIRSIPDLIIIM